MRVYLKQMDAWLCSWPLITRSSFKADMVPLGSSNYHMEQLEGLHFVPLLYFLLGSICTETWVGFQGRGEVVPQIPNLITHLLKWCPPAAQTALAPTAQILRLLEHFSINPRFPTLWTEHTSRKSYYAVYSFNSSINYDGEGKNINFNW